MKRFVVLMLLTSMFAIGLSAQESAPKRVGWGENMPNIVGNVESVTVYEYTVKEVFGKVVKDELQRKIYYRFDAQGNVAERVVQEDYLEGGEGYNRTPLNRKASGHDEQGNVVEEIIYNGDISQIGNTRRGVTNEPVVEIDDNSAVVSVGESLQGQIAGVEVMNTDNESESLSAIRVRGTRSIVASDMPLVVVDGVVDAVSSLEEINSSDIKHVTVLKDPASTAAYGPRGANGVILVTTHSANGGAQKGQVSVVEPKAMIRYKIVYRQ